MNTAESIWAQMKLFNRGWNILYNEERPDLDSSPNYIREVKSRRVRQVGHVARRGLRRDARVHLMGKREEKSSFGRPKCRREGDIKLDLIENYLEDSDFYTVAQDW